MVILFYLQGIFQSMSFPFDVTLYVPSGCPTIWVPFVFFPYKSPPVVLPFLITAVSL